MGLDQDCLGPLVVTGGGARVLAAGHERGCIRAMISIAYACSSTVLSLMHQCAASLQGVADQAG
jgi:hypothetical protein